MKGRVLNRRQAETLKDRMTIGLSDAAVAMACAEGGDAALQALCTALVTLGYACNSNPEALGKELHRFADDLPEILRDMHRVNAAPANSKELPS